MSAKILSFNSHPSRNNLRNKISLVSGSEVPAEELDEEIECEPETGRFISVDSEPQEIPDSAKKRFENLELLSEIYGIDDPEIAAVVGLWRRIRDRAWQREIDLNKAREKLDCFYETSRDKIPKDVFVRLRLKIAALELEKAMPLIDGIINQ